jgi:Flp pilus assembly pilin Flp
MKLRQRGQAMTEYLLILVMLVVLCMVTMRLAGTTVEKIYSNISASLSHNVTYCTARSAAAQARAAARMHPLTS